MSLVLDFPNNVLEESLREEHLSALLDPVDGGVDEDGRLVGAAALGVVGHPRGLV